VKVFFDNCTSPVLATTLDGFVQHFSHRAFHIKDLKCGRHATDVEWIRFLATDGPDWIVITGDDRVYRNKAERAAYRSAGLRGFVLNRAYQKTPMNQIASVLLWRWPEMLRIAELVGGAALYGLPVNRRGKLTQLPL